MEKKIVARVEDLMFRAKIDAAARNLSVPVSFMASPEEILTLAKDPPAAVLVELTPAAVEAVAGLKKKAGGRQVPVVGFFSHVDRKLAESARAAGVDRLLSRAQFSENLPELILEYTSPGVERRVQEEPELPEE